MTETTSRIAANVRAELARAGVSVTELAPRINMTTMALHRRLAATTEFRASELFDVATELQVEMTTIYPPIPQALAAGDSSAPKRAAS